MCLKTLIIFTLLQLRNWSKSCSLRCGMKKSVANAWTSLRPVVVSKLFLSLIIAIAITSLTINFNFFGVEAYFYDLRVRLKGEEKPDSRIHLIVMENNEGDLNEHLAALKRMIQDRPAVIAYLNKFDSSEVEANPKLAEEFVRTANEAQAQGIQIYFGTDVDLGGEILPPYPLSLLPHSPIVLHKDGTIFGEDKVVRRALLTLLDEPSLHLRIAYPQLSKKQLLEKAATLRGSYFFKPAEAWHTLIRYPGNTDTKNKSFPSDTFVNIAEGKHNVSLKNKIVIVGPIRKDAVNDFVFTPYSRITYNNPKLYAHAAIIDTLLKDRGIIIVPTKVDIGITFLLSLILVYITLLYSPTRGVLTVLALSIVLFFSSLVLFKFFGLWLRLVHPLFSMFCAYYMLVPYRAILEYKKRWEVQQKHDLLLQVEEMKGNFLSLMSHDLKTPVARIQGLAELVLKQGNLKPEQKSEMRQIIDSTESLDKFISKILNLTKVESEEIKIHKKSKDINKILEQCAHKLEFQAKRKNISLDLRLEPLFPIPIDAPLIIQVFTNLIDNAIKYSPEGSCVEILSRELEDKVEITVRDTGFGLDEKEREQLFTKFFRGHSYPGDQTKGSGLGLYLSKYFIELHEGKVWAESEKGQGSKFIIQLPIHTVSV